MACLGQMLKQAPHRVHMDVEASTGNSPRMDALLWGGGCRCGKTGAGFCSTIFFVAYYFVDSLSFFLILYRRTKNVCHQLIHVRRSYIPRYFSQNDRLVMYGYFSAYALRRAFRYLQYFQLAWIIRLKTVQNSCCDLVRMAAVPLTGSTTTIEVRR